MSNLVKLTDKGRPTALRLQRFTLTRLFRLARDGSAAGTPASAGTSQPGAAAPVPPTRPSFGVSPAVRQLALFAAAMALVLVLAIVGLRALGSGTQAASSSVDPVSSAAESGTLAPGASVETAVTGPARRAPREAAPPTLPVKRAATPGRHRPSRAEPLPAVASTVPVHPPLPY